MTQREMGTAGTGHGRDGSSCVVSFQQHKRTVPLYRCPSVFRDEGGHVMRPSWDEYFMQIAEVVKTRSTCLRRQVGAVIVKDKQILSTGYNGAPTEIGRAHV